MFPFSNCNCNLFEMIVLSGKPGTIWHVCLPPTKTERLTRLNYFLCEHKHNSSEWGRHCKWVGQRKRPSVTLKPAFTWQWERNTLRGQQPTRKLLMTDTSLCHFKGDLEVSRQTQMFMEFQTHTDIHTHFTYGKLLLRCFVFCPLQPIQRHDNMHGGAVECGRVLLPKPRCSRLLPIHPLPVFPKLFWDRAAVRPSARGGGHPHSHPRKPHPCLGVPGGLEK